jgi:transposase
VGRIEALLRDPDNELHALVLADCLDLLEQISEKSGRIDARTRTTTALSAQARVTRRLQTIPGVGPLTALAVETFAPPMQSFESCRAFAAWIGIVPRQHSSGGKQRLGRISKAGQGGRRL